MCDNKISKAELRKTHKPIMEKRRRAKINNCLNEIKDLILSALKKDPERHAKLEKADILEMAVRHLKEVQNNVQKTTIHHPTSNAEVAVKYRLGYIECAQEVEKVVRSEFPASPVGERLIRHLERQNGSLALTPPLTPHAKRLTVITNADERYRLAQPPVDNTARSSVENVRNGLLTFAVDRSAFIKYEKPSNNINNNNEAPKDGMWRPW